MISLNQEPSSNISMQAELAEQIYIYSVIVLHSICISSQVQMSSKSTSITMILAAFPCRTQTPVLFATVVYSVRIPKHFLQEKSLLTLYTMSCPMAWHVRHGDQTLANPGLGRLGDPSKPTFSMAAHTTNNWPYLSVHGQIDMAQILTSHLIDIWRFICAPSGQYLCCIQCTDKPPDIHRYQSDTDQILNCWLQAHLIQSIADISNLDLNLIDQDKAADIR